MSKGVHCLGIPSVISTLSGSQEVSCSSTTDTVITHEFLKHAMHRFAELGSIGVPAITVNHYPKAHRNEKRETYHSPRTTHGVQKAGQRTPSLQLLVVVVVVCRYGRHLNQLW